MQDKLFKLFIGAVLFGTLVALTVMNVPNSGRVTDLCYGALIGLGILHLTPATSTDASPKSSEGGFARVAFLPILIILGLLSASLTGCATSTASTQVSYIQACATYNTAFGTALILRESGKLNASQIQQITLLDSQITPICTGPLPTNPDAAMIQITAAVTSLAIIETIQKE